MITQENIINEKSSEREFVIGREFQAMRESVWEAWTDPARMADWWGPRDFTNPVCDMDVRPGGAYRIVMRSPDGAECPLKGEYLEVVRPNRLVFTMDHSELPDSWHDLVNPNRAKGNHNAPGDVASTVIFDQVGGRTKLTIRTRFESVAIRNAMLKLGMNEGWSESLDCLGALLAKT